MPGGEFRIQSEKQPCHDRRMECETMGRVGLKGRIHDGGAGEAGHDDLQGDEREERMAAGKGGGGDGNVAHVGFLRFVERASVDDFLSTVDIPP